MGHGAEATKAVRSQSQRRATATKREPKITLTVITLRVEVVPWNGRDADVFDEVHGRVHGVKLPDDWDATVVREQVIRPARGGDPKPDGAERIGQDPPLVLKVRAESREV